MRERALIRTIFTRRRVFRALYYPWRKGGSTGSLTPTQSNIKPQNGRKGKALRVTFLAHLQQQLVPWHCFLILGIPGKGLVSQGNPGQKTCYRHQSEHHLETLQRKVTTLGSKNAQMFIPMTVGRCKVIQDCLGFCFSVVPSFSHNCTVNPLLSLPQPQGKKVPNKPPHHPSLLILSPLPLIIIHW